MTSSERGTSFALFVREKVMMEAILIYIDYGVRVWCGWWCIGDYPAGRQQRKNVFSLAFENLNCNFPSFSKRHRKLGKLKITIFSKERKKIRWEWRVASLFLFFFFSFLIFYVRILFSKAIKIYFLSLVTQNMTKIDQIISLPTIHKLKKFGHLVIHQHNP